LEPQAFGKVVEKTGVTRRAELMRRLLQK